MKMAMMEMAGAPPRNARIATVAPGQAFPATKASRSALENGLSGGVW
jgi:hypothetical protein